MRRRIFTIAVLFIVFGWVLGGCRQSSTTGVGDLELTLELNSGIYQLGDRPRATFIVKNRSNDDVVLNRIDTPALELFLENMENGDQILIWSNGTGIDIDPFSVIIKSNRSLRIKWKLPVLEEGFYQICGLIWIYNSEAQKCIPFSYGIGSY